MGYRFYVGCDWAHSRRYPSVRQTAKALKPGSLLFVATPAFQQFWSYKDDLGNTRVVMREAAQHNCRTSGLSTFRFTLLHVFLEPTLCVESLKIGFDKFSQEQKRQVVEDQHKVSATPLNETLAAVFAAENLIGYWLSFPWGTSVLGVFQKP